MINRPFESILPPLGPMVLFAPDYPLTDEEIADLKALYGQDVLVRTSSFVPSGKVLKCNVPDPIERVKERVAAMDRIIRWSSPASDVAES